jgi:hypothetical protein
MFVCPAFVMTAIADDPEAASWVIAVCRRSAAGLMQREAVLSRSRPDGCSRADFRAEVMKVGSALLKFAALSEFVVHSPDA